MVPIRTDRGPHWSFGMKYNDIPGKAVYFWFFTPHYELPSLCNNASTESSISVAVSAASFLI